MGGTSAAAPQWAGLIAVADQGLGLAGIGSLANAQAALYAIPSSSFHQVTSGFNGYSAGGGYDLVTGLGTPIANRVVAGLLSTRGVYNVTGFASPYVPGGLTSLSALPTMEVNSSTNSLQLPAPGTSVATAFPAPFPSIVVIVFPLGPTHVVVFLSVPPPNHSLFASNNHPVQPETPSLLGMSSGTPSTLNSFGQIATTDTLLWRSRFGSEPEIAALIDVVEPLEAPLPGAAPNKASTPLQPGATVSLSPRNFLFPQRLDRGPESRGVSEIGLTGSGSATPLLTAAPRDEELETTSAAPRLAFAAALAGAGYWIALRERKGWNSALTAARADRSLRPRVRRCSFFSF